MLLRIDGKWKFGLPVLLAGLLLAGCGNDGGMSTDSGQGAVSVALTDSSTDEYQAVYVTIARVEALHDSSGTWETVAEPNGTYNLLDLVNGIQQPLGMTPLDAGHYPELRLIIGLTPDNEQNILGKDHPAANYVIDKDDGEIHDLKVPSGINTGLKILNGFDIAANQTTELCLDFDAMRSVVKAGKSGQYLLKPTVRVVPGQASQTSQAGPAGAVVTGSVTGSKSMLNWSLEAVPGAFISAQTVNDQATEERDHVVIQAGTLADTNGGYSLALQAGNYNLVVVHNSYWRTACTAVALSAAETVQLDFQLEPVEMGTIDGSITIDSPTGEQTATLEFRREMDCGSGPTTITVKSLQIADGGTFMVDLPLGDYQLVATTDNRETIVSDTLTVTSWGGPTVDISFL